MGHLTEFGRIKRIILRRPEQAFLSQENIDAQWYDLNYTEKPNYDKAVAEYDRLVTFLQKLDMRIDFLPADGRLTLDSLYVRDAAIVSHEGAILCSMGKPQRMHEPAVAKSAFTDLGIPVAGAIEGSGRLEGGDVVWLNDETLAVGRTYRTNEKGIDQLISLGTEAEIIPVHLPHYRGPADVFHLMSILSPLDHDLALVYT